MIVLDTDHLSALQRTDSKPGARLFERISPYPDRDIAITIITVEEERRGRLAVIRRKARGIDEVLAYDDLLRLVDYYLSWTILPFDQTAASRFDELRKQKVRVGTMDLKIASIVLVRGITLLSANLRDFEQVAGLRVEDWLRD